MKRLMTMAAAVAAACLVGCGGETVHLNSVSGDEVETASPSPAPAQEQSAGLSADIRILGENNPGNTWLSAHLKDIKVEANGQILPLELGQSDLNLAQATHSWLLGTVAIPEDVEKLKVTVAFEDFGSISSGAEEGRVDYRGSPITFEADTALMKRNGHVVLHAQLDRMLAETHPGEWVALKNFMVRY